MGHGFLYEDSTGVATFKARASLGGCCHLHDENLFEELSTREAGNPLCKHLGTHYSRSWLKEVDSRRRWNDSLLSPSDTSIHFRAGLTRLKFPFSNTDAIRAANVPL